MALVIGKKYNLKTLNAHFTNRERLILATPNSNAILKQFNTEGGPSVTSFGSFFVGDYGNKFEVRNGSINNTPALIQADPISETLTFSQNVSCSSNLSVTGLIDAPTIQSLESFSGSATSSNLIIIANPDTNDDLLSIASDTSIVSINKNRGVFNADGDVFKLGIGVTSPEYQLHVREDVMVEGTLCNATAIYAPQLVSSVNSCNSLFFSPDSNVLTGDTNITGGLNVQGNLRLEQGQEFIQLRVSCNLNAMNIHVSNLDPFDAPSLLIDHIIPTYTETFIDEVTECNIVVEYACNVEPIIKVNVTIPDLETTYNALTMDPFGRVGLGTNKPEYFLSLEGGEYNKDYLGKGLIYAKSSLYSEIGGEPCDDIFTVNRYAQVGIGTDNPEHFLHIDICHRQEHSNAIIGLHKNDCHECPFFEFSCNQVPIAMMDRDGALFIGEGISNVVKSFEDADIFLGISGDAYIDGNIYTNGIAGIEGLINLNQSFLSNISQLDASNVIIKNLTGETIDVVRIDTQNLTIPGLEISTEAFSTSLSTFSFTGDVAIFSADLSTLPSTITIPELYKDPTQGKLQVVVPLTDTNQDLQLTNMLKLEGPTPAIIMKNLVDVEGNSGEGTRARLQFDCQNIAESTEFKGALSFQNGKFIIEHTNETETSATDVLSTYKNHFNVMNGLIGAYTDTDRKVYLNFSVSSIDVDKAPDLDIKDPQFASFTNGVVMNGDLFVTNTSAGVNAKLTVIGDAEITGNLRARNSIMQWSDSNLKDDIRPIDDALNKVLRMQGRSFVMKNSVDNLREIGIVAQEVAPILPEVVRKSTDGNLAVAYGNLAGVFVEAIKELNAKVENLTSIVNQQQIELQKLANQ